MEYQFYTTDALILGGTAKGEANKRLALLTRDAGLVYADAQRIRDTRSKLRFALQQFSLARVSLVYGKGGWRVVNAVPLFSFWSRFRRSPSHARRRAARIARVMRQVIAGEDPHSRAFFILYESWSILTSSAITAGEADAIECIAVTRLLYELGYLAPEEHLTQLLRAGSMTGARVREVQQERRKVVTAINRSLEATHLV